MMSSTAPCESRGEKRSRENSSCSGESEPRFVFPNPEPAPDRARGDKAAPTPNLGCEGPRAKPACHPTLLPLPGRRRSGGAACSPPARPPRALSSLPCFGRRIVQASLDCRWQMSLPENTAPLHPMRWANYEFLPSPIIGFHGCDQSVGEAILRGEVTYLELSRNDYDWLGSGVYFWEGNPKRALQFAQERAAGGLNSRGEIVKPFFLAGLCPL